MLDHDIDEQLVLGGDIAVDRSRLQADMLGEVAQCHGLEAMLGDEFDSGLADGFFSFGADRASGPCHVSSQAFRSFDPCSWG